jgi:digeranylgeranylglycerophospholipid reductase
MLETDVLVVGAGPAGSSAAKHAALNGADVLMIDKKSEIGAPKRCAEGVSHGELQTLGIKLSSRWVMNEIKGIRMVSPNGTEVWFNQEMVGITETGYILERKVFDKHMAMDAARAGSNIMIKTLATGLRKEHDHVIVSANRMGKSLDIKAKIVIGADGSESRIGRWTGLETTVAPKNMISGIQFEMVGVELQEPDSIEFYFGEVAPGGYAWIFPKGDDIANVGLGVLNTRTEKSAYQHLVEFVENCPATESAVAVELNVGGVPVSGPHKKTVTDKVMIVGDAAGQVNPVTGAGIMSGMTCGLIAGEVAASAVKDNDISKKALSEYEIRWKKEIKEPFNKYLKLKEYLSSLSDDELDSIAKAFNEADFKKMDTTDFIKMMVKASPKAFLKLGKLFF